jgi:hypothetical protein
VLGPGYGERHETPTGGPKSATQVEVLAVEKIPFVESLDLFKSGPSDEESGSRQALDVHRVVGDALHVIGKLWDTAHQPSNPRNPK